MKIARVALDVPLEQAFDFRVPDGLDPPRGSLVVVPFGRAAKVGVVTARPTRTEVPENRLRELAKVVDDVAPLAERDFALLEFCASYYHRPLGEVIQASLPPRLRQAKRRAIKPPAAVAPAQGPFGSPVEATPEQAAALDRIREGFGRFHPVLLAGITGSGKTEVYLRLIAQALARGSQALYLVPEIGLTPQLEERVRGRFPGVPIVAAHSHLGEGERAAAWLAAQSGRARIVLGTRLAALSPMPDLGLIVVDEEHDPSYKQHEGLRYSARDVAVRRAQMAGIPVVLGSATPSLETWANAQQGRYALVELKGRALEGATLPAVRMVDTRADKPLDGVTDALLRALRARVARGEQSLVFLNRRGFSPVLFCRSCAWHSTCGRCSANLVLHMKAGELRCHHCGHRERVPARCPGCGSADLAPVGHGTQRIEETLAAALPGARIVRVDRDSTARKGAFAEMLGQVRDEKIDILVGTQMLAKGHDYPRLTLVGVIDSDCALYSADFRAGERLFSLLTQVAGRAGRAGVKGEVIIQTDFPTHPLYAAVAAHDYAAFAGVALEERRAAHFPPFAHIALLRAESKHPGEATAFLRSAVKLARTLGGKVEIFDPVPAPLERKAGYDRAQLLVRAASRATLQPFLRRWKAALDEQAERRVRWSLDVDPQEA
ncbi:MAG: primosomal protein N' [Betaproteobacteria bacterium]|nr:primosomal protein N' [Betaproteobacteria bacterium]